MQAATGQDKLRTSGTECHDLQATIRLCKKTDAGLPLQYENFRD